MFTHSPVAALKPMPTSSRFKTLNDNRTFKTSVVSDLTYWLFKCTKNDVDTCCFVAFSFEYFSYFIVYVYKCSTTTRYDTFFNCSTSCVQCIFNTKFAFF